MKLGAVNVAAITPHRDIGYQTDLGATLELVDYLCSAVDYLCSAGVHGIVLLGSTGEFVHMSLEDRAHLVRLAVKRSRVPVIAGVTHSTLDGTISLAEDAARSGAAAVLAMPPYFFPYGQPEVREFYVQLSARLAGAIPIFLYNIPLFTSEIAVETSRELLASGSFAGIKDSSGNIDHFSKLRAQKESTPFTLLVGSDRIFTRGRCD
jgi:4-hydroxy-tetrahydrodipicolinate synthase